MSFETAMPQWEAGMRRVGRASMGDRQVLERVVGRLVDELRRRLGGPFTVDELVELYEQGTGWCSGVAIAAAPDHPAAWEEALTADAAFARYLREASDYAGGMRRGIEDELDQPARYD